MSLYARIRERRFFATKTIFVPSPVPYAERDPLPVANEFVARVVYPLLDRGFSAKPDDRFSRELAAFIADARSPVSGKPPIVIATHTNDFALMRKMLRLADRSAEYQEELRYSESLIDRIRIAFAGNPELARRRHHALTDAQVLQSVYRGWQQIGRSTI